MLLKELVEATIENKSIFISPKVTTDHSVLDLPIPNNPNVNFPLLMGNWRTLGSEERED